MPCDEHLCRVRVVAYRVMGVYSAVTRIEPVHGYGIDASVDGQCTCTLALFIEYVRGLRGAPQIVVLFSARQW